jgi:hypothetical protein
MSIRKNSFLIIDQPAGILIASPGDESIILLDTGTACAQPSAFDIHVHFTVGAALHHINISHDAFGCLGLNRHCRRGGVWRHAGLLNYDLLCRFRYDLSCAITFFVRLEHVVLVQIFLGDAAFRYMRGGLARPGPHGLFNPGALFRRHPRQASGGTGMPVIKLVVVISHAPTLAFKESASAYKGIATAQATVHLRRVLANILAP